MPSHKLTAGPGHPVVVLIISGAALWLSLGCGASTGVHKKTADAPAVTRLEPIHVRASADGEAADAYSARILFERGYRAFDHQDYLAAAEDYQKLVDEFVGSEYAAAALYNLGLCYEKLQRDDEAAATYRLLLERQPDFEDRVATLFQLAGAYERLGSWEPALEILVQLSRDGELDNLERFEAEVRRGAMLRQIGRLEEAGRALSDATLRFRQWFGPNPSTPVYYYAMAWYESGEVFHARMRNATLPADETALEPALETKCQLLLEAQLQYTRAIKVGHPHFASGAAYRIGALYRELWDDIVTAPAPADMDDEQREVYREILTARVRVLLHKALIQWERTLKMADRLELDNEWVSQTREDIEEIRALLAEPDSP